MKLKLLPQTPSQTDVAVSDLGVRSPLETVKEPPFDGLLLDGRKISEVRDIVAKMENLFEVIVPSDIHFQEYDNDMIIDLPAFNFELLTPELLNLYDVVMADSQFIWEECLKEIKFKIGSKTETLALEKIKGVADSENALVRLHQLVDARIVQLASLQATHENEAAFLLDAIDLMQTNFKGKINNVIDEIHDYAEFTIPDTNSRLSKCRTMYQLHNLRKQFEILIERFNFDVEEAMNEASVDFDKTKKNIALSMQKGHHSSAWQLIKESGAYRQSTFDSVLGLWKIGITENVAKDMKEVTAQIAKTLKEFDSVGKDFELEDILSANMKSLRTKLRAESTWCKNHFDSLRKSVKDFRFDSLNCSSWSKSLSLLSSAIEIDEVVLKFVEYLSLEPLSNNFVYSFSIKPTQTSWKEWKSDSRYTAASINSATHRPPNRKKSVSSRFPQLEALKLNVSTTDINRIKNDVTKSTSTPSFSQPSKDDILLPPLPTKLSQTPSLINLEGLESEPIHDLSKLFRAWTTAAREKLVQAYEVSM